MNDRGQADRVAACEPVGLGVEVALWTRAIEAAGDGWLTVVRVVPEIDSTQDELRRTGAVPGMLVAALRQSAGRGRLGRRWIDGEGLGVALSVCLPAASPARLMMLGGLAALAAVEKAIDPAPTSCAGASRVVGLKWPNDVILDGRKVAGVLVESGGGVAIVGVGVNVRQRSLDREIRDRATSLALLGARTERWQVAADVVAALRALVNCGDDELVGRYQAHDALRGTRQAFSSGDRRVVGEVLAIDPLRAIRLRTDDGELVDIDPAGAAVVRP